jgi:hypothetical protein
MNNKTAWTYLGRAAALCLATSGLACSDSVSGDKDDAEEVTAIPQASTAPIALLPLPASGLPLETPNLTWTYVEFADTKCRTGSPAGIALSRNAASDKLMIYFEGGGACFDSTSCLISPGTTDGFTAEKKEGLFNRAHAENPVADWNIVYVPYCTGDTFGGTRADSVVPGVDGVHQFVGYNNTKTFLQRIVPTFPNVKDILVTGISAGGYGAAQSAVLVQRAFPATKVKLLDDSGPGFSTAVMPECLQAKWRELWGLDGSFLAECGDRCPNKNDFTRDYALAMARTFQDRPSGLIESVQDAIISRFFGAGLNNCTGRSLLDQVPLDIYTADLLSFRDAVSVTPNFGTYLPQSTQHTWIGADGLYKAEFNGVRLIDWVSRIVRGEVPGHVGP